MTQSSISQTEKSITLEALAKDAAVASIIQVGGLLLTYLVQVFLARWMGKTEYGIYEYVIAWSLLLAIPAGLGLPRTVMRLISEYRVRQDWGLLRGIVQGSWRLTVLVSLLLGLVATGIILLLNHYRGFVYATPLLFGMSLVPLLALRQLHLETARAMQDVILGYAPSLLIWPFLVLCSGLVLVERNHSLTSLPMIGVAAMTLLVVVGCQSWLLWNKIDTEVEPATPVYAYREWMGISLNLVVQQAFFIILDQTDLIMVGSLIEPAAAGIYNVAVKTALWVTFVMQILNMVAAPAFTILYTQGDIQGLQKIVSRVNIWIFWPSVVIAFCLLAFTQPILSIFGSDFIAASWTLKVLVLGRLVDAFCGSVGALMFMTGHQKKSLPVFGCCALINVVGNAIAIPRLGMVGAAITTSCTLVLWNVLLCILVVKHIKVRPSIFSSLPTWKDSSRTLPENSVD